MSILDQFSVVPCTPECVDGVGMGTYADIEVWHHIDCPNHTIRCCSLPDEEE